MQLLHRDSDSVKRAGRFVFSELLVADFAVARTASGQDERRRLVWGLKRRDAIEMRFEKFERGNLLGTSRAEISEMEE